MELRAAQPSIHNAAEVPGSGQRATRSLSLRTNFAWTFAGNVVYAGCQWGMLVVLAKLGTPEMVGQFALALAVTAPVFMFTNLQLRGIQATDARRDYAFGDYLGLRLLTSLVALAAIIGLIGVSGYGLATAAVVLVVGLAKTFESISDVFYGLLQQHEQMDRIAISMMIKGVLSLAALGAGVSLTGSVLWGAVGLALVWAALLATYDVRSGALILRRALHAEIAPHDGAAALFQPKPQWHFKTLGRMAWLALPLGLTMMLGSLNANIPRYFVEHYLGTHELGLFAAIGYLMVVGTTVVSALGQSATPRLAQLYTQHKWPSFRLLMLQLGCISASLGVLGIGIAVVAGGPILNLLYTPEYAKYADVLVWSMMAAGLSYVSSVLGYGMTAARIFKLQVPLNITFILVAAVSLLLLVPTFGLVGAAWATCFMFAIQIPLKILGLAQAFKNP